MNGNHDQYDDAKKKKIIDKMYKAVREGDRDTIRTLLSEDSVFVVNAPECIPWAGDFRGFDGLIDML